MFLSHIPCANQQLSFSRSGTSTINSQSEYKTSNSIIAEKHLNNTILPRKKTSMVTLPSKICKIIHSFKTLE